MFRKVCLIVCAWALVWTLGTGVFADTVTKVNSAVKIEILDPKVGSEGDVILKKDTLYVKVRISGGGPVYMSLYRIDPEFYLGSLPKADVNFLPDGDFESLSEDQKLEYRRQVYLKKNAEEAALSAARGAYDEALAQVKKAFGDAAKMEALKTAGTLTPAQLPLYEKHRKAQAELSQKRKDYAAVKALYDKYFTRLIQGPTELVPLELLMTCQTEIPGVKPGTYVLAFSENADGTGILKTLEFKGETSEKAVENILNTLPESRSSIFN